MPIIYLVLELLLVSSDLPEVDSEAGSFIPLFSLASSEVYRMDCHQPTSALLPHYFTLTDKSAVYFLLPYLSY